VWKGELKVPSTATPKLTPEFPIDQEGGPIGRLVVYVIAAEAAGRQRANATIRLRNHVVHRLDLADRILRQDGIHVFVLR